MRMCWLARHLALSLYSGEISCYRRSALAALSSSPTTNGDGGGDNYPPTAAHRAALARGALAAAQRKAPLALACHAARRRGMARRRHICNGGSAYLRISRKQAARMS